VYFLNPLAVRTELPGAFTRIADRQNCERVAFAARTFGASAGVIADASLQHIAARHLARHGEIVKEPLALRDQCLSHAYKQSRFGCLRQYRSNKIQENFCENRT
jgi:hypothetical protein